MKEIFIHPNLTGINSYLQIRDKVRTSKSLQQDCWIIGSNDYARFSFEDFCEAFSLEQPELFQQEYKKVYQKFLGSNQEIDWSLALGKNLFAKEILSFKKEVLPLIEEIESSSYFSTLSKAREIFDYLVPITVDEKKVQSFIDAGENIESLLPKSANQCHPIKYSHGTKTGRLKVVSGPRVLNLSKERRSLIKSRYPGGKIMFVDFVALEPTLALKAVKNDIGTQDVYEIISNETSEPRAKVKIAILCLLYGSSANIGLSHKLKNFAKKFFRVSELEKLIESQNQKNGYGRPLLIEESRYAIPYWVQSTASDVCLLGFSKFAKEINSIADPLFLVHDALFLDVPPDSLRTIQMIVNEGFDVSPYGHFNVSLKEAECHE